MTNPKTLEQVREAITRGDVVVLEFGDHMQEDWAQWQEAIQAARERKVDPSALDKLIAEFAAMRALVAKPYIVLADVNALRGEQIFAEWRKLSEAGQFNPYVHVVPRFPMRTEIDIETGAQMYTEVGELTEEQYNALKKRAGIE